MENILSVDSRGVLDLTKKLGNDGYNALVIGLDSEGKPDPTKPIATLTYTDANGYALDNADSSLEELKTVKLGSAVRSFTTPIETKVTTSTGAYTVNGKAFTARAALTITTAKDSAILTSGTVTLEKGGEVTTPNNTVKATEGAITVALSGNNITIGVLNAGDAFTVDGTTYKMTDIGLQKDNLVKIVDSSITIADLGGDDWQTIMQATNGAVTIDSKTDSDVMLVDTETDPKKSAKYGILTKAGNEYTFKQDGSDKLTSITLNNVKVNLDKSCAGTTITASGATLTVTASNAFTVDATVSTLALDGVSDISLTAGTIQANEGIPITANGKRITATNGVMNVGISSECKVVVSDLDTGDKFTVGTTTYEMTSAGLYDAANKQIVTAGVSSDLKTFTVDDAATGAVISVDTDGILDLSKKLGSDGYTALVVGLTDETPDPTKPIATLTYTDANGYALDNADSSLEELKTVKLGSAVRSFTTPIETKVTTSTGAYTVNSKTFTAQTALKITTAKDSAILTSGIVTLNEAGDVTTTSDNIKATTGTITVKVSGTTVTIGALNAGDVFTVGGTEYTMTTIGLTNGNLVKEISSGSIKVDSLANDWQALKQAPNGALTIDSSTASDLMIVDTTEDPTKAVKYGTLTKSGNTYTFSQSGSGTLTSVTVDSVKAVLDKSCSGATINSGGTTLTATASDTFTVDATLSTLTLEGVSDISLTAGTIQANEGIPITANGKRITATNGVMNVGISSECKVVVSDLDTGDKFTVGATTYEMTAVGLYDAANKQIVTAGVSSDLKTFTVDDAETGAVVSVDSRGVLDLSKKLGNDGYMALVVGLTDATADPTKPIATLTYTDTNGYSLTNPGSDLDELGSVKLGTAVRSFTTPIEIKVYTLANTTYSINGKTFTGRTSLTITTAKDSAILTSGIVTLNENSDVMTTNGNIKATTGMITVKVSGSTVGIGALNTGDTFTIGDYTYEKTTSGFRRKDTAGSTSVWANADIDVEEGVTLQELYAVDNWTASLSVEDDIIVKSDSELGQLQNGTKIYGVLDKEGNDFVLRNTSKNSDPRSIQVEGVTLKIDTGYETVPIKLSNAVLNTADYHTITGTVDSLALNTMTVTPINGDKFDIDNVEYEKTAAGLVRGNKIWYRNSKSVRLPGDEKNWWSLLKLSNNDTTLDLSGVTSNAVVITEDLSTRRASLTYTAESATYVLTDTGTAIDKIKLGNDTLTLTTTFASTVETGVGTYTVNNTTYSGNKLTIAATARSSSTLTEGTVTLTDSSGAVTATEDNAIQVNSGSITAKATSGKWDTVGGLTAGDKFTIDGTVYQVLNDGKKFAKLDSSGGYLLFDGNITDAGTLTYKEITEGTFGYVLPIGANGILDLTRKLGNDGYTALVVGLTDGATDPTKDITTLKYTDADGYTLNKLGSAVDDLKQINLGTSVRKLSTEIETTITTATGAYTINGKAFKAKTALTIEKNDDNLTLTGGTVTLNKGYEVETPAHTIKATTGTITVKVASGKVTIGALNKGDAFTVDGKTYTLTALGLQDGNRVKDVSTSVTVDALNSGWHTIKEITNGALTINTSTANNLLILDTSDSNKMIKYGTLTKSGTAYTFTQSGSDALNSIKLNNVSATFPATCSIATFSTNTAEFSITTASSFTIDSTTNIPSIKGATAISLMAGTIQANKNVPVTADGERVTVTAGNATVGIVKGKVVVGELDTGDKFKIGNTSYEMKSTGLYNATSKKTVTTGVSDDLTTFTVGYMATNEGTNGIDQINNSTSNATINSKGGDDSIFNTGDTVFIDSGTGNDYIYNTGDEVTISGSKGNDSIRSYGNESVLEGGAGNDLILNCGDDSTIDGGTGNDVIRNYGDNVLFNYRAGDGNDLIEGFRADSTLKIGDSTYSKKTVDDDVIITVGKKSKIILQDAASLKAVNIISSLTLTDDAAAKVTLNTLTDMAEATARKTAIKITGNALDNTILGGSGKDSIYGKDGADYLRGNAGSDNIYGGAGDDTLIGGKGNDSLWGNNGADTFIYNSGDGKDFIVGFDDTDILQITGTFSASVNSAGNVVFKVGSTASAITLKSFTATNFNINGDTYKISGGKLVKK